MKVPENEQEKIEHKANKQGQSQEQGAQETLVEQGHKNEQQRKTYDIDICAFPEDDEILMKTDEVERYNEEEKGLLMRVMRVVKEIRYDPERIPPNLRYIDWKKVKAATVKINKTVSLIKTETITETNSVLHAAGNIALKWQVTKLRR